MYLYVCEKMRNPAWESIIKHIVLPGCLTSFSCAVLAFFVIAMHCFMQRENRLRESLGTFIFITLFKASSVYLWRYEMKQNFPKIPLLEILYVLVHASQNQKKPSFFPSLPCL